MSSHDEPNCFCCPEPVELGIESKMIICANDHESEDLHVVLFHHYSWASPLVSIYTTAYFIFEERYALFNYNPL